MSRQNVRSEAIPSVAVVVNDDAIQLSALSALVRRAGLESQAFTEAEAALAAMDAARPPDLIITDLYMPGIDGWRFCRLLRSPEYAAFNHVPILVISATYAGEEPERIAADVGAEAFLAAPVDGSLFIEQVRAIVEGRKVRTPLRVLIVEDSKTLAGLLKKALKNHGCDVAAVMTFQAAVAVLEQNTFDAAVIDFHLPDKNGDALLDMFRAQQPECVCIMMTTDPRPELALDWMKRGAAAYLRKPFEPDYLIAMCIRARRERTLLRAQEMRWRLQSIIEGTQVGTWEWNVQTGELVLNETWAGITGYTLAELRPVSIRTWENFAHPDDLRISNALLKRHFAGELADYECECRMKHKDGRWVWVLDRGRVITRSSDGRPLMMFGTHFDITGRKRAEEALRETEEQYRRLYETMAQGVIYQDSGGHIISVNPAAQRILGFSGEQMLGKTPADSMWHMLREDGTVLPGHEHPAILAIQTRTPVEQCIMGVMNPGRNVCVWLSVTVIPLFHPGSSAPYQVYSVFDDITGRKHAEEEREKLQAQLNQAQKMESVGRLAGGVAHDFNNMLGVILGHTELALQSVGPDEPLHADLEEIRSAAERSAALTRQLLAFARKQIVAPRVLDLNETVEGMLTMLRRLIGEDLELVWLPGRNIWPVNMDPSQIDQILANLCVNARDAIAGVGRVTIETGTSVFDDAYCADHAGFVPGEYVLLAVSDNGCGMDRETLANLFEPFFTTKEPGKGTGLGLATVYGIVKQNNGFINVYSEPGQGTTFKIYLPRHMVKGTQRSADSAQPAAPVARGTETILLVEDEPSILSLAARMLEMQGYRVLAAATPGEALRVAQEHSGVIHLLMTDVVMPEMNGRELANKLLCRYSGLKRLFMSGYTANVIAHHGVLDEGVYFMQKPFTRKDLAARVRAALDAG